MRKDKISTQYGALPYVIRGGELSVLLITTRDGGRWLLPKGWPEKDMAPHELAALEAFEEAGMLGTIAQHPIGSFVHMKRIESGIRPCRVVVFPLQVEQQLDEWPEMQQRSRKWLSPAEAASRVREPDLAGLILAFAHPATSSRAHRA
jgi:8-oxo-dGTP pyrophosphatase MutT (NUDIX family)